MVIDIGLLRYIIKSLNNVFWFDKIKYFLYIYDVENFDV